MKRGFTMIELIFVIVILGILAAVALPKMAATRDDAKISAVATEVGNAIQSISAYYMATGDSTSFNNAFNWSSKWDTTVADTFEINATGTGANRQYVRLIRRENTTTGEVNISVDSNGTAISKLIPSQEIQLKASSVTY